MMAIEVHPPVMRPGMLPRSCSREDGSPKVIYHHRRQARRAARLMRLSFPGVQAYRCRHGEHHHVGHRQAWRDAALTCARCGRSDGTVSQTITLDGRRWPPTCSECSAKIMRIRAVARVEARA